MFKHILVAVDGSELALQALRTAVELGRTCGSRLSVVFVVNPYPFVGVGTDFAYGQAQYLQAANSEADSALSEAGNLLTSEAAGLSHQVLRVEADSVHAGILDTATAQRADLLVVGSHGRSAIEKLVLGSVTQRVLSGSHLPVLVVRD
ncbi:MAG: universal stress protein [Xylophilus ampelinus]